MACDSPFFIRTQQSYLKAWYYFLATNSQPYKFFVNPNPLSIDDITMNKQRIEMWIDGPVKCTPEVFHINGSFIFSRDHIKQNQFNQNNFLIPFMSGNEGFIQTLVTAELPLFKFINMMAHTLTTDDVRKAFNDWLESAAAASPNGKPEDLIGGDKEFDFEYVNHKQFIKPKCSYYSEVLKQALVPNLNAEEGQQRRVLALVDKNMIEFLSEHWERHVRIHKRENKQVMTINKLSSFYEVATQTGAQDPKPTDTDPESFKKKLLEDLLKPPEQSKVTGTEYFEKLVMLDFMYSNPITHYFIKFKRFPYPLEGVSDMRFLRDIDNMLVVWYYHFDKCQKEVVETFARNNPNSRRTNEDQTEYKSDGLVN